MDLRTQFIYFYEISEERPWGISGYECYLLTKDNHSNTFNFYKEDLGYITNATLGFSDYNLLDCKRKNKAPVIHTLPAIMG